MVVNFQHMRFDTYHHPDQAGFSLIELLVSLLILTFGLLGLAALQARATNAEFESYQRSQAVMLANDMVERIRTNRANMGYFKAISNAADGTGYIGATGAGEYTLTCPPSDPTNRAGADLCEWSELLVGSAESLGANKVGAMIGARGCIFYDASTEIPGVADTGIFTVAVSWQGSLDTVVPTLNGIPVNCANDLYGAETKRRTITMPFRMANLK